MIGYQKQAHSEMYTSDPYVTSLQDFKELRDISIVLSNLTPIMNRVGKHSLVTRDLVSEPRGDSVATIFRIW